MRGPLGCIVMGWAFWGCIMLAVIYGVVHFVLKFW